MRRVALALGWLCAVGAIALPAVAGAVMLGLACAALLCWVLASAARTDRLGRLIRTVRSRNGAGSAAPAGRPVDPLPVPHERRGSGTSAARDTACVKTG